MRIRKSLAAAAVGVSVVGLAVGVSPVPAFASVGVAIYPYSQSAASGASVSWGGSWGTSGHRFNVTFSYGDGGTSSLYNTTATSYGWSRSFSTCTGKTFTEKLSVTDLTTGDTGYALAYTTVSRGNMC